MHTVLADVYGSVNKQKQLWQFHFVVFHMQSAYLLKLTVRLRIQFVSVSPVNVRWGQTRSLGLRFGEHKTFRGSRLLFSLYFLIKKFPWQNKIWSGLNKFRGIAPECPRGYRPDSDFPDTSLNRHYLMKQSSSDERGLTTFTVIFGTIGHSIKNWMLAVFFSYIKRTGL